jgi:ZIP family zinc transporter
MLHLAAGVIFAVVAVEFLPDLMHTDAVTVTALGFAAGTAAMLGIRALTRRAEESADDASGAEAGARARALPWGLLFATGVDLAIDGLVLGIAFSAGGRQGVLLTLALAIELASLGLAMSASLRERGVAPGTVGLCACALALLFGASTVAGGVSLRGLSPTALAAFLAFGSAALLYLVTEELLTEAHEIPESPWLTAVFFVGFLVLFLIEMAAG